MSDADRGRAFHALRAYRWCMRALGASIAVHVVALLAMIALLGPGLDVAAPALARATYVAEHPLAWRVGWSAWQLTALSDLAFSGALLVLCLRLRHGGVWAALGLLATVVALIPDQWAEWLFVTSFVSQATDVVSGRGDLAEYVQEEARLLVLTGSCGASGYIVMAALWLVTVVSLGGGFARQRGFAVLGALMLALFAATVFPNAAAAGAATVEGGYPEHGYVRFGNALAFALLVMWMVWIADVLGCAIKSREEATDAHLHALRAPRGAWPRRLLFRLAGSAGLRDLVRWCTPPPPVMQSDIEDVVYLNWFVPTERVASLVPAPLRVHSIDGFTVISLLTYRHGGFGPALLGPLRRFFPSPVQSNWRLYTEPEHDGAERDAVYFFKAQLASDVLVAGSRLGADGLPAHRPAVARHERAGATVTTHLESGGGSAPGLHSVVSEVDACEVDASEVDGRDVGGRAVAQHVERALGDWDAVVRYLVPQNRGVNVVHGDVISSRIDIPVRLDQVRPARIDVLSCPFLDEITAGCVPFAFVAPRVAFAALGEDISVAREPA